MWHNFIIDQFFDFFYVWCDADSSTFPFADHKHIGLQNFWQYFTDIIEYDFTAVVVV